MEGGGAGFEPSRGFWHNMPLNSAGARHPARDIGSGRVGSDQVRVKTVMLLQTNSYIVPKDKRTEHARLILRFKQTLARLGCDHFEAYEQVGANWSPTEATGRFVQIMRFRDRKHQQQIQAAERTDPGAQQLIKEFCELINFPYQQQQGLFAVGFYSSILPSSVPRIPPPPPQPHAMESSPPAQSAPGENGPVDAPPVPPAPPVDEEPSSPPLLDSNNEEPEQHSRAAEDVAGEILLRPEGEAGGAAGAAEASGANGEFNLDEFIDEASPKKPQPDPSADRAMQFEP